MEYLWKLTPDGLIQMARGIALYDVEWRENTRDFKISQSAKLAK